MVKVIKYLKKYCQLHPEISEAVVIELYGQSTGNQFTLMICNAVACPHLKRSGMGTACSRSVSAHLYHAGSRLLPCDGAAD